MVLSLVPHHPVDMKPVDDPAHIDYIAFSAHKMYAPFGIGVLIAPKETFREGFSDIVGGGTVDLVTPEGSHMGSSLLKKKKQELQTFWSSGLSGKHKDIKKIGMKKISEYERRLN